MEHESNVEAPPDLKVGLAEMLAGGVILDVVNAEQAKIAEQAGAVAVMALERVPADIRAQGGVARMSSPELIAEIAQAVSLPVMAKCRIGHAAEAQILEALGVDFIDESEVLTPADARHHIDKRCFRVPFVCGARSLGEALRRIAEGAALVRTKGEAGTGDVAEAVRHLRQIRRQVRRVLSLEEDELVAEARALGAPLAQLRLLRERGRLPVPSFAAGGVATPADAALLMQLGAEAVFVGSGVFKSESPERYARAIVDAVAAHRDPRRLLEASGGLPAAMRGREARTLTDTGRLARRGA